MSTTKTRLAAALGAEAHRRRMVDQVRGYALGQGTMSDWRHIDSVPDHKLERAIGDAGDVEEAVARVSHQLDELTAEI